MAEAARIWTDDERLELFAWIADDPGAGTVIPGSGGCRKVRWSRPGAGKQGGTRVIYFTRLHAGELWMLLVYPKTVKDNIRSSILRQIRREIEVSATEPNGESSSAEDLGAMLLQSVCEMKSGQAARVTRVEPSEIAQARQSMGLSQAEFAAALHISRRTLQEWEQGRRSPSGAALALIRIAVRHPEIVRESLG